jgi:hypothetical protein
MILLYLYSRSLQRHPGSVSGSLGAQRGGHVGVQFKEEDMAAGGW